MCCNVRGCIGFVLGVFFAVIIAALTSVGAIFGIISISNIAFVIIALAMLLMFLSVLFLTNADGCCFKEEKRICKLKSCIKAVIISGIIAVVLSAAAFSIFEFFIIAAVILFFAVIALFIAIFSFIGLISCRTEHCEEETECEKMRR